LSKRVEITSARTRAAEAGGSDPPLTKGIAVVRRAKSRTRDMLAYLGLRIFAGLVRALPLEPVAAAMGWGWRLIGPITRRQRRVMENLALALPNVSEGDRKRIAKQQWENLGRTALEGLRIDLFIRDQERIEVAIDSSLEATLGRPGGLVFVSMHSANWEIAAIPFRRYRVALGLYKTIKNPLVDTYVAGLRQPIYPGGLLTHGTNVPSRVIRWVRAGNAMAMLADQREPDGVDVTLFGMPVKATPFPAMVARRLGVPLLAVRTRRLPRSRFKAEIVEIPVEVSDDWQADVVATTQALQNQYERWIRDRPGEWMWVHDRWREFRKISATKLAGARHAEHVPSREWHKGRAL
jgi:KDO2-lipid IV(A) lauroyltransferase